MKEVVLRIGIFISKFKDYLKNHRMRGEKIGFKSIWLISFSLFCTYGSEFTPLASCKSTSDAYCVTTNITSPNISYTTADHKNAQVNITNATPLPTKPTPTNALLKAFGKTPSDYINITGNINQNSNPIDINFTNTTYNGNISIKYLLSKTSSQKDSINLEHSTINGNMTFINTLDDFTIKNSTINGNFYYNSVNSPTTIKFENSIFNGNVSFLANLLPSANSSYKGLLNMMPVISSSTFKNSKIIFGFAPGVDKNKFTSLGTFKLNNDSFYNSDLYLLYAYNMIDFKNSTYKGGSIIINNDWKGSEIPVNILGSNINVSRLEITGSQEAKGSTFIFGKISSSDVDNHSGLEKTTSFQGNIVLKGGTNTLNIKDSSLLKSGTISIDGGVNTFNITDNSKLENMNISVFREIKILPQAYKAGDAIPDGYICTQDSRICYSDPTNTFNYTNASMTNGNIEITGGKSNDMSFTNSSFTNGNISLLAGSKNTLTFTDTPMIGGDILIIGGNDNQLSFNNSKLNAQTAAFITPDTTTHLNAIKGSIITMKMTPEFLKKIKSIKPDLFFGDLILSSSMGTNTKNTINFSNGNILGNIKIENDKADNPNSNSFVNTSINLNQNLFVGNIVSNGDEMLTKTSLSNSAMIGNITTSKGINYLKLDNSQLYGDIITRGGVGIISASNQSVFAGSMDTYDGTSFIDLNMSLYTNQNDKISKINTYNGISNISLYVDKTTAQMLTSQHIYPTFYIGNYNGAKSNIAVQGPVSGSALINYSGGTSNLIFADGGNATDTKNFFMNTPSVCSSDGEISQSCLTSGEATFDYKKNIFKINGYTYTNGIAITLDANKADEILEPFRNLYPTNFVSITIDKTGINPTTKVQDNIYRMKIDGVIVGAEYNLPATSDQKYAVTFAPYSAFIGNMQAKTDNTTFVFFQGAKLILDNGSQSTISKLTSKSGSFKTDIDTMFQSSLSQKNNVIIDLATSGKEVNRTFAKDKFSTIIVNNIDNFNNAIFRVAISPSKIDNNPNIKTNSNNSDRIIIQDVQAGEHLSNYLQVYQDFTSLHTGNLSGNNILVAVVKNSSSPNTQMVFDTSASKVLQGYDIVNTILYTKPVSINATTGAIDINPATDTANATGYFIKSASTSINPSDLNDTNNAITSNYSIFLANINNLNKRLGELRDNYYAQGVYSRIFSGLNTSKRGDESKIYSTNIQFGYDYGWSTNNGQQFLGTAFTYGLNSLRGKSYNGNANLFELAGYYSYVNNSGFYTDTILKYTYISNNISIKDNAIYNIPLNTNGGSIGQELGYRFYTDKKKTFYIEPSGEVIAGLMNGGVINQINQSALLDYKPEYAPSLKANLGYILSFRAKVGGALGYRVFTSKSQIDFRLGAFYVADVVSGGITKYKTNYSSTQVLLYPNQQMMINLGVNSVVSDNWRVYADFDTGFLGKYFNQNYLVSVGLRYEFGHSLTPLAAKIAEEKRIASVQHSKARYEERIARIQAQQEKIKQKEAFEAKKAQIMATQKAQLKAIKANRVQQEKLEKNNFKMLELEIAKILKNNPSAEAIKNVHTKEIQLFQSSTSRKAQDLLNDQNLALQLLQSRQKRELQALENKQSKEAKELEEKSNKTYQELLAKQAKEIAKVDSKTKSILEKKQLKDSTDLKNKQAKALKEFQANQSKALKNFKEKQSEQTKDLQNKQSKQTKQNQNDTQKAYEKLLKKQEKEVQTAQKLEKEMADKKLKEQQDKEKQNKKEQEKNKKSASKK